MRTLIVYGFMAVALSFTGLAVQAQNSLQLNIGYNVNIPTGSFRDYISNPAYKGFTAALFYPLTDCFSLGLSLGYNDYYQKYSRQVYHNGSGSDVSAVLSNSIQQVPLLATAQYVFLKKGIILPYIGGGAGLNFISFDQYLGEFDNPQSFAKLALSGEAGLLIPLSSYSSTALKISVGYNYTPLNKYGLNNLNTWGIGAGVRIPLH